MKEIKKVAIGVIAMALLLVAADWAVGSWSEIMYYKSKYGIFHRQIYCLQESKDDILILGSSRAAHHYVPQIFEDSLGMTCYNAGSDGECIYYNYVLLAAAIKRGCTPKIVLYEAMPTDVCVSYTGSFNLDDALDRYAPHYGELDEIDDLFSMKGWKERIKLLSKTYRYNSKLVQTIKCNYMPQFEDKGYEALTRVMDESMVNQEAKYSESDIEPEKVTYVNKLITLCEENDIKLVFCYSPSYQDKGSNGIDCLKDIAKDNNIKFIDSSMDKRFQKMEYFADQIHLNDKGARVYTAEIVRCLNE